MRRPTFAHIVFGVHLEETDGQWLGKHGTIVLGLEPDPGFQGAFVVACDKRQGLISKRLHGTSRRRDTMVYVWAGVGRRGTPDSRPAHQARGFRLPTLPSGFLIAKQVPFGTSLNELP